MTTQTKARPVHEVRLGRIKAAIWENETQNGTRHNVTLSRLYKDGDDWKDSTSFGRDDLPRLKIFEDGRDVLVHGGGYCHGGIITINAGSVMPGWGGAIHIAYQSTASGTARIPKISLPRT